MKLIAHIRRWDASEPEVRSFEWDAPTDNLDEALELAFREFNVVEEGDSHIARKCRSMSTNDMVQIEDRWFLCAAMGWMELAPYKARYVLDKPIYPQGLYSYV